MTRSRDGNNRTTLHVAVDHALFSSSHRRTPEPRDRKRTIEYAGGFSTWAEKKTLEFRKTTFRYRPNGSVESKRVQLHRYVLRPGLRARIEWEEDGKKVVLINNGRRAWKIPANA